MTENFWMELIRIIGGILTLTITGIIAYKQLKQGKKQEEIKGSVATLKEEMNGHMTKLLEKTAEVGVKQGKAEEKSEAADIKIKDLEIKIKPEPLKKGRR